MTVTAPDKPVNTSGMECPLHSKPCSETCHKCELWLSFPMQPDPAQPVMNHWNCALKWAATLQYLNNAQNEGLQKNMETLREQVVGQRKEFHATARAALAYLPPPEQKVIELNGTPA